MNEECELDKSIRGTCYHFVIDLAVLDVQGDNMVSLYFCRFLARFSY